MYPYAKEDYSTLEQETQYKGSHMSEEEGIRDCNCIESLTLSTSNPEDSGERIALVHDVNKLWDAERTSF